MANTPLIRCIPQVHLSLETALTPIVLIGRAEVALVPPNNGFEPQSFQYFIRTKCSRFTNNAYSANHGIYCLTETLLNDTNFSINIFLASYSVLRADIDFLNSHTTRGDGVLVAVSNLLQGVMRRHDLATTKECVLVEIPVSDNFIQLIGNNYFSPDCNVTITDNYLYFLEQNLNGYKYQVIMIGYFNIPNYGWINGASLPNSYYSNKVKGNSIHMAICSLGLDQCNNSIIKSAQLGLIFSIISDLMASILSSNMVTPDKYLPLLLPDFNLNLDCHLISMTTHRSYTQGLPVAL
jgi:hypothetical protein